MVLLAILLFAMFGLVGMTHIIVDSKILSPLREWVRNKHIPFILGHELYEMMTCPQCAGFWVGMTGCWFFLPFIPIEWTTTQKIFTPFMAFFSGCAIALLAPLFRAIQDWFILNVQIPESFINEQEETIETGN